MGKDAVGISLATISRLKSMWFEELKTWQSRRLAGKRYAYFGADGVYRNARMGERPRLLVIIAATENGKKGLVAIQDGYRESEQSWNEILLDLKSRGLQRPPQLALGGGALGFWNAHHKVYGKTRMQRC